MPEITIHSYQLPLRHTFTIAHGSHSVQDTLIVELRDEKHNGLGESTTNPYYGATLENMTEAINKVKKTVESEKWSTPEELWQMVSRDFKNNSFALCALDMAVHDWYGKKMGKPLYKLWDLKIDHIPVSNFTIGIDTVENMVKKIREMEWPLYKIKLGTPNDLKIIEALRKETNAPFRVDANCGWGVDETISNSRILKDFNVEFIEQPLPATDLKGMKKVFHESELPVIADESCQKEADVDTCYQHFHGVNIKLVKCGGITPGLRMIARAQELGMKKMVGCMTESSVGISAIAHLAPLLDYVDMDGALLLAEDIADGVTVHPEGVDFPAENGTGARLKNETKS